MFVTRTNKAVTAFEPVQKLESVKGAQHFRLDGEGSAGPLDLFAAVTVDGGPKDATYQTHVLPQLSISFTRRTLSSGSVRVTVRVTDAGDPIQGARVSGLPGGSKTTGANGRAVFTIPASRRGSYRVTASKAGYKSAVG